MTIPVNRLLDVARSEIGYVESGGSDGHSGNVTKYWAELDPKLQGQPWCAALVSWCFIKAGAPLPAVDRAYGFILCSDEVRYAKEHGIWRESNPQPGDIVIYDFRAGTGTARHTGIVEVVHGPKDITAIEGNTSPGAAGSQANGGGVYRRRRSGDDILGFADIKFTEVVPVRAMYDPPLGPIAAVWRDEHDRVIAAVAPNGDVYAWGCPYRGAPSHHKYWGSQTAVAIKANPTYNPAIETSSPYIVQGSDNTGPDDHWYGVGDGGFGKPDA